MIQTPEAARREEFISVFGDRPELKPFSPFGVGGSVYDLKLIYFDKQIPYGMFAPGTKHGAEKKRVGCFVDYTKDDRGNAIRRTRFYYWEGQLGIGVIDYRINSQASAIWTASYHSSLSNNGQDNVELQILADDNTDTTPAIAQCQYRIGAMVPTSVDIALGSVDELKRQGLSPLDLVRPSSPIKPVQAVSLRKSRNGIVFTYAVYDRTAGATAWEVGKIGNYGVVHEERLGYDIGIRLDHSRFIINRSSTSGQKGDWVFELPFVNLDKFDDLFRGPAYGNLPGRFLSTFPQLYPVDFKDQQVT